MKEKVLVSVYNKKYIAELCKELKKLGYEIITTDGTGKILTENNIKYIPTKEITKNPNQLTDCIQTISFNIPAGILFNRSNNNHIKSIKNLNIEPISIVICNFPPISENLKNTKDFNIQHIDVGGPLMVRSAATNFKDTIVVVNPNDYSKLIEYLKNGEIPINIRKKFATEAFNYCKLYDESIVNYLNNNNFNF